MPILSKGKAAQAQPTSPSGGADDDAATTPTEVSVTSVPAAPRLRRRPLLIVVGVALAVMGALTGVWLWSSASTSVEVVMVRADVQRGAVIPVAALGKARVTVDPSVQTVPGDQMASMVGKLAATDLSAGSLLTPSQVTDHLPPGQGMSMVGVPIQPGLMPAEPLRPGDTVRLVLTPGPSGEAPTKAPGTTTAQVVRVTPGDTQTVVDVIVTSDEAAKLAAQAATGKLAVVLESRDR